MRAGEILLLGLVLVGVGYLVYLEEERQARLTGALESIAMNLQLDRIKGD